MNLRNIIHTRFLLLTLAMALLIVSSGCQKGNDMGKLYGQWQLMSIERPGQPTETPDNPRLYMSFDQHLLQLTTTDDSEMFDGRYIAQVAGEEPDLTFSFPYDTTPEQMRILTRWGIDANPVTVRILTLEGSLLKMKAGENILILRRF